MWRWAGRLVASFGGRYCGCRGVVYDRKREFEGILDLQLPGAPVETGVVQFAALRLHRGAGCLRFRLTMMSMVRGHLMLVRRRAMRTVMICLERHRAWLQRQVQPHGSKQPQGGMAPGPGEGHALCVTTQVFVSA